MEGAIMLMLLTAFLVFVVYRMDQNEKKSPREEDETLNDDYVRGFKDGMNWGVGREQPIDITPIVKSIRKRKR